MINHQPSALSHQLSDLLPVTISAARDAGRAILEIYQNDMEIEYKADKSPLTAADRASHEILSSHLKAAPIQIPILSEEGRDILFTERREWETFWLVDPLDGTKEFIKQNGEFTVNIALVQNGSPQLGIIYVPVKDSLYFAAVGIGSWKLESASELPEQASPDQIIKQANRLPFDFDSELSGSKQSVPLTVVESRSHVSEEFKSFIGNLKQKYRKVDFISAGSSLKFCLVAEGKANIYPRLGPTMEWDTGAGQVIVEQAGGVVLDADRQTPLRYNKKNLLNPWFIVKGKEYPLQETLK